MLTLDIAMELVSKALKIGREQNVALAVAVVDTGGRVIAAARSEKAGFVNLDVARKKATAAANFSAPTQTILEMIKADSFLLDSVINEPELSLIPGGFPIPMNGAVVGGLGIAGGHYSQDQKIGEQALKAL